MRKFTNKRTGFRSEPKLERQLRPATSIQQELTAAAARSIPR